MSAYPMSTFSRGRAWWACSVEKSSAPQPSAQSLRLEIKIAVPSVAVGAFLWLVCYRWSGQGTESFQSEALKDRIPSKG